MKLKFWQLSFLAIIGLAALSGCVQQKSALELHSGLSAIDSMELKGEDYFRALENLRQEAGKSAGQNELQAIEPLIELRIQLESMRSNARLAQGRISEIQGSMDCSPEGPIMGAAGYYSEAASSAQKAVQSYESARSIDPGIAGRDSGLVEGLSDTIGQLEFVKSELEGACAGQPSE